MTTIVLVSQADTAKPFFHYDGRKLENTAVQVNTLMLLDIIHRTQKRAECRVEYKVDCIKVKTEIRQILLLMGFQEMKTNQFVESSFWNFDVLYQPQQHPVTALPACLCQHLRRSKHAGLRSC